MKKILLFLLSISFIFVYATCDRTEMFEFAQCGNAEKAFIFVGIPTVNGDLLGIDNADQICQNEWQATWPHRKFLLVRAFLSVPERPIKDLVPSCLYDKPVYGLLNTDVEGLISTTWNGLWDGTIDGQLDTNAGSGPSWWSGSDTNGNAVTVNCQVWTSSITGFGRTGVAGATDATWINNVDNACNTGTTLLCVGY